MADASRQITECLDQLAAGDEGALNRVMPLIYDDLKRIARGMRQGVGATLHPTALVHEAYGRLAGAGAKTYEGRKHFMRVAALAMRQLLADNARDRRRLKRGGDAQRVTLQTGDAEQREVEFDVVAVNDALEKLSETYERQARVVELRFLTGLSIEETAEVLGLSKRTVTSDWKLARAWLSRELDGGEGQSL